MKVTPLYNLVLVKPPANAGDIKTKSGIIVTEHTTRAVKTQIGEVVAVGCGIITSEGNLMKLQVKPGDKILYIRGTGLDVRQEADGDELLMFKESELLGIVQPEDESFPQLGNIRTVTM